MALITRAFYGLTTSAERFRTLLADYLRSLGFNPSRYDRDVLVRLREKRMAMTTSAPMLTILKLLHKMQIVGLLRSHTTSWLSPMVLVVTTCVMTILTMKI